MPLNKACVGRVFRSSERTLSSDEGIAYARATLDTTASVLSGERLPPMLAVNPLIDTAMLACRDPEMGVDRLRLVHGEEDIRFFREILPGEIVRPESTVLGVHSKTSGELLVLEHRLFRANELVVLSRSTYFIRSLTPSRDTPSRTSRLPKSEPQSEHKSDALVASNLSIPSTPSESYAAASRGFNAIHIDNDYAKKAGLPGCILHGLCTMAIAANQVVHHLADKDPAQLSRLAVRFSSLVLPEDTLSIKAHRMESHSATEDGFNLTVLNQRKERVLTKARAYLKRRELLLP